MKDWRQVLSWQLVPELTEQEKRYVLNTGRMPQGKFQALGLNLDNYGKWKDKRLPGGAVYIASDVFRYIIEVQEGDEIAHYSIDYSELVDEGIPLFDFNQVINWAISNGPEDTTEGNIEELLQDEDANIIELN